MNAELFSSLCRGSRNFPVYRLPTSLNSGDLVFPYEPYRFLLQMTAGRFLRQPAAMIGSCTLNGVLQKKVWSLGS